MVLEDRGRFGSRVGKIGADVGLARFAEDWDPRRLSGGAAPTDCGVGVGESIAREGGEW